MRDRLPEIVFGFVFLIIIGLFVYMLSGFLMPAFLATFVAVLLYPLVQKLNSKWNAPSVNCLLTCIFFFILIIIPFTLFSIILVRQSYDAYVFLSERVDSELVHQLAGCVESKLGICNAFDHVQNGNLTKIGASFQEAFVKQDTFFKTVQELLKGIYSVVKPVFETIAQFALDLTFFFILLFFFLKDGQNISSFVISAIPLAQSLKKKVVQHFIDVTYATVYGMLATSVIQGLVGALGMYFLGIDNSLLLGGLMMITALIPFGGTAFVWLPVGIFQLASGEVWTGIGVLVFGMLIVGTIDNLLRPFLMGDQIKLHPLLILFSVIGGLETFGAAGIFLGPMVAVLLLTFVEFFRITFKNSLNH